MSIGRELMSRDEAINANLRMGPFGPIRSVLGQFIVFPQVRENKYGSLEWEYKNVSNDMYLILEEEDIAYRVGTMGGGRNFYWLMEPRDVRNWDQPWFMLDDYGIRYSRDEFWQVILHRERIFLPHEHGLDKKIVFVDGMKEYWYHGFETILSPTNITFRRQLKERYLAPRPKEETVNKKNCARCGEAIKEGEEKAEIAIGIIHQNCFLPEDEIA